MSADDTAGWWTELEARYSESQRAYHTLAHIDEMFGYFEECKSQLKDADAVSLAIFFHDVIYDPRSGSPQNELDSANLFDKFAQEAMPFRTSEGRSKGEMADKVWKWIVQTAHHRCSSEDEIDCRFFMDFDMAVLGRPWPEYEVYSKQIRKEYCHVSEALFCTARSAFLVTTASSSSAGSIYATDAFKDEREAQAHENARREATVLQSKLKTLSLSSRLFAVTALKVKGLAHQRWAQLLLGGCLGGSLLRVATLLGPSQSALLIGIPLVTAASLLGGWLLFAAHHVRQPLLAQSSVKGGKAVIAGSYNPPHLGHLEVIRIISQIHDEVHVVIGVNPAKTYAVSPYQRQELLRAMVRDMHLSNVKIVVWRGYIWKYAQEINATLMYRGIRTWAKDGLAEKYLELQNVMGQLLLGKRWLVVNTAYLEGLDAKFQGFSSTLLRTRIKEGKAIDDLVPTSCREAVIEAYSSTWISK